MRLQENFDHARLALMTLQPNLLINKPGKPAFFAVFGFGPLLVTGPLVGWIVSALEGAAVVGGVSAVGTGLYSIGVPKDSALKYETALKENKFVIVAYGTAEEVARAKDMIRTTKPN